MKRRRAISGASSWQIFRSITPPLALLAVAGVGLMSFTLS